MEKLVWQLAKPPAQQKKYHKLQLSTIMRAKQVS